MQSQAQSRQAQSRLAQAIPSRSRHLAFAFGLAAALSTTFGCGSGVLQSVSGSQSEAAPAASALGPQLGYLWMDSDHTLRPILGVAGSSQIGQSLVPAGTYISAVTSASAHVAILQDSGGAFDLMSLPSGSPSSLAVRLPAGAVMRLSPSATSALLYAPGSASASLVTGLPSSPQVAAVKFAGPILDAAVADSGAAAAEYSQGTSVGLSVTPLSGHTVGVANLGAGGGLSFLPGHDDLLFADATANTLTLARSASSTPVSAQIQTASLLKSPAAVGVSGSGRWALVVNRAAGSGSQSLVRVDLTTSSSVAVSCSCTPTEAAVLHDDGTFRVTNVKTGANWIVDAAAATPRTLFIPAFPQTAKATLVADNIGH